MPKLKVFSRESWLIRENKWLPLKQNINETKFTFGNGFMSARGSLEEKPLDSIGGFFFAGVFDSAACPAGQFFA